MYVPEIKFLNSENLPEILKINSESPWPWPDEVIMSDFRENSQEEISYIGAFGTNSEAPLLGYAVLGREKKSGVLMALLVDRNYHRMGIGSQLILAVSDCAEFLNYKRLRLRVRKTNVPAISLYKKMSFIKESVRSGYYSDGEDAFVMSAGLPLGKNKNKNASLYSIQRRIFNFI